MTRKFKSILRLDRWTIPACLALGMALWVSACAPAAPMPPPPTPTPLPAPGSSCIDFEDPTVGTGYVVGDVFTDSGITINVLSFQWSGGGWTYDGFAEISAASLAGGSGQDVNTNNVNLGFKIGGPVSGLSLLFGEYGGNINLSINGDFQNFQDFAGLTAIGGVAVNVVNGLGNDTGSIEFSGSMEEFAFLEEEFLLVIGGQELWIDHVCWTK